MNSSQVHLLVVDDDDVAAEAVVRGFRKQQLPNHITLASDGVEALAKLRGDDNTEAIPRPVVVLLDIKMPRMDGLQFLHELRADPELRDTVVFMLTTSSHSADIKCAYEHHVAGYVNKKDAGTLFANAANMLGRYCAVVTLPE